MVALLESMVALLESMVALLESMVDVAVALQIRITTMNNKQ